MISEVVIVQVSPVFESFVSKWCIDELNELGIKTIILDTSPVVRPDLDQYLKQSRLHTDEKNNIEYIRVKDRKEMAIFFEKKKNTFFFTMFYNDYHTKYVYRLIKKNSIKYGNLSGISSDLGIDDVEGEIPFRKRMTIEHLKGALYNRFLRIFNNYLPKFLAVSSKRNEKYQIKINLCRRNVSILRLHSYDYENFLRTKSFVNDGKPYCVFLDPYVPFHPDIIIDAERKVDANKYYHEMRDFFNRVSTIFSCEIIIASHPRADPIKLKEHWEGYNVLFGKTAELVKGAQIVLTHFSNSTALGIMAYKPIIIVANEELYKVGYFYNRCKNYADMLSLNLFLSPDDIDETATIFNRATYKKFIEERITFQEHSAPCLWKEVICQANKSE